MTAGTDRADHEAASLPAGKLAAWLKEHLGRQVTAYAVGLSDPGLLGRYAAGMCVPSDQELDRMCCAYQAARRLTDAYGDTTASSWFFGTSPSLADRAPAAVLREAAGPAEMDSVVQAARAFVANDFS
ncbi:MAG: XRE family transcriptional regulator [Actinomycetota bacterium]|nr:XRE family transcriptional regulator [Actinomycetota bacterium]